MVQFGKRFVSGHRFSDAAKLDNSRRLKPSAHNLLLADACNRLRKNAWRTTIGQRGLKPGMILRALRGAEAPLFHVAERIRVFFRKF